MSDGNVEFYILNILLDLFINLHLGTSTDD